MFGDEGMGIELPSDPHGGDTGGGGIDAPPPINKAYAWVGDCNRSANDAMRTIRRNFSRFGDFSEHVTGIGVGFISFAPGAVTLGRVINISTGAIVSGSTPAVKGRNISVTVTAASTQRFTFTTNPGHVFYPGQISFSAQDNAAGKVAFSITLSGQLADRQATAAFYVGFGTFEDDSWHHFLGLVSRLCGNAK
jgi:hypothetical protein